VGQEDNGSSRVYVEKPEREECRVSGPGCLSIPSIQIQCVVEGHSLRLCTVCYSAWRQQVRTFPPLALRCPKCASLQSAIQGEATAKPPPAPLAGPAASAIDAAMHSEGITIDIRTAVLRRLQVDASWLADVSPVTFQTPDGPATGVSVRLTAERGI
jgi:hypothetical protein